VRFLFRRRGYARAVREDEETGAEAPEADEHPESEPTSLEDGRSTGPREGPLDDPAEGEGTHRGW
jgi:hypothetical protein